MVDEDLINRVKQKDMEAFKQLYDLYREKVFFTAYSVLKDKALAEDALQEVFIKVYTRINDLKVAYRFDAWIYRIAVNASRDIYARKRDIIFSPIDDEEGNFIEIPDTSEDSLPEEVVLNREASKEMMKIIYDLPEHHRVPLVLFYFNNMSIEDIAFTMECSSGTIKSRLHNGKKTLRQRLIKDNYTYRKGSLFEGSVNSYENG
jgi:RNA polymerase sigma-70 factor (ECF subfamily)